MKKKKMDIKLLVFVIWVRKGASVIRLASVSAVTWLVLGNPLPSISNDALIFKLIPILEVET